jgi:hypothetical protein
MITMSRQLLSGTPEDVRCTMEDLARDQDDHEYLDGARFRQLAVQLATRDGLAVSAVTCDDGAVYELEVTLASAPHQDAIVIDRSQPGRVNPNWPHGSPLIWPHREQRRGR